MNLKIAYLYPKMLNLYGDSGNILCFQKRLLWRDIDCKVKEIEKEDICDLTKFDIIFIGGGQDFEQSLIINDLKNYKGSSLKEAVENGVVVLSICGGYQLLGKYYKTKDGKVMNFTNILDFYTVGKKDRLIGNYSFVTKDKLQIVGFENHSGRTYLGKNISPLGKITKGYGNNAKDKTEGVHYKNTFGTYCHGPLLPKNPEFADKLLTIALNRKYDDEIKLLKLDDTVEKIARKQVKGLYIC